jgi:hypothetical protein
MTISTNLSFDKLVRNLQSASFVIPSRIGVRDDDRAEIQYVHTVTKNLDPVFQRGDDFLRTHRIYVLVPKTLTLPSPLKRGGFGWGISFHPGSLASSRACSFFLIEHRWRKKDKELGFVILAILLLKEPSYNG